MSVAKPRQSVPYFLSMFRSCKSRAEAEAKVEEWLKDCHRPTQRVICENALEFKYGPKEGYVEAVEEDISVKILEDYNTGATKKYLRATYNIGAKELNEIVGVKKKTEPAKKKDDDLELEL